MRIERISIDGFGIWHDATFTPHHDLTVLVGGNEAGKTTLLALVRAILFGFEPNRYPALSGGRRGGALDVVTGEGRRYRIERHGDRRGEGRLVIRDEAGDEKPPGVLGRLLHGVEAAVYRNIFAFRLEELTEFRGLTEGDIASRIYGAGLGTGGASALAIEERLRREAADVFKVGGQNPTINRLLKELDQVEQELATLDIPAVYAETHRRLAAAEATRAELSDRLAELESERRRLERITSGWDAWIMYRSATDALAATPAVEELPADAVERLSRLDADLRASSERVEDARRPRARLEQQLSETLPDRELLERRAEIEAVLAARDVDRGRDNLLATNREELGVANRRLRETLAELGAGWDEDRLGRIDTSVAVRAELTGRFRDLLDGSRRQLELAEHAHALAADASARATAEVAEVDRRLGALPAIFPAAGDLDATGGGAPRRVPSQRRWLTVLIASIGSVAAVALALGGSPAAAGVVIAATAIAAAWLWLSRGIALRPGAVVEARRAGLEEQRAPIVARGAAAASELEAAARRLADARAGSVAARHEWASWLAAHDLDPGLDREAALAMIDAAVAARALLERRDDSARLGERTATSRAAFDAEGRVLLASLGRTAAVERPLREALDRLARDLHRAETAATTRARLEEQLAEACEAEAAASERMARDEAARTAFLDECGVQSEADLRRRALDLAERVAHEQHAAGAKETLVALSGPGPAFDELLAQLGAVDEIAERRDRLVWLRDDLDALSEERDTAGEEIGGLQHELRRLETSVEASDLRQGRADLVARLEAEAERWCVRSLAVKLLVQTRGRYEREHRPGVIRAAESYVRDWTAGRYPRLIAPLGKPIDGLEREDGRIIPLAGLSRGTAEQLYLALRFGLIEHFADEAEPLPIVMDEILVNFDAARAAMTAAAVRGLAERHQVLYFTCHDATARLLDPDGDQTLRLG
jgi:uncharacterized protein YhaN